MKKAETPTLRLLNSVYKYLVAAIFIFIPLYPKFPVFTLPFTYVAIRSEDFLIFLAVFVLFIKTIYEKKLVFPKISFQFMVFLLVATVSSLSAILITKEVNPLLVLLHLFRRFEYISVFFLVYFATKNTSHRRYYLELAVLPFFGVFLYGIAQIYLGAPVISTMDSESSKGLALTLRPGVTLNSTFAGHYDLAIYLTMIMSFLVSLTMYSKKYLHRLVFFIPFIMSLWLFTQAGSRIGLLGLLMSIGFITYIYRQYFLGLLFFLLVFLSILSTPQYLNRFKSILNVFQASIINTFSLEVMAEEVKLPETKRAIEQDTSTSIRFDVEWPRALRSFYKNPFLGTGYSSITLATDNDYLRALGETGLLGLLSLLALLLALWQKLWRFQSQMVGVDRLIIVSALGVFISFCVSAIFIDVFESSKIAIMFWAIMGLAFSLEKKYV